MVNNTLMSKSIDERILDSVDRQQRGEQVRRGLIQNRGEILNSKQLIESISEDIDGAKGDELDRMCKDIINDIDVLSDNASNLLNSEYKLYTMLIQIKAVTKGREVPPDLFSKMSSLDDSFRSFFSTIENILNFIEKQAEFVRVTVLGLVAEAALDSPEVREAVDSISITDNLKQVRECRLKIQSEIEPLADKEPPLAEKEMDEIIDIY